MAKNNTQTLLNKSIAINIGLIIALVLSNLLTFYFILHHGTQTVVAQGNTTTTTVTTNQSASGTLAGIDKPFNSTELATINNASYQSYETAGEKLLNGTLTNQVIPSNSPQYNALIINGKPSVVYIGAISCIFCGENRWAMALALGKLGSFSSLYYGYSSLGDGDVPTVYWSADNVTTAQGVHFGSNYSSKYINFLPIEFESPITAGFQLPPTGLAFAAQQSRNATYSTAISFMNGTGKFQGTPFTLWGTHLVPGADAVIFGNSTPTGTTSLPLAHMTHAQVLSAFRSFNSQFAYSEFAAADVYLAYACPSINNTATICQLPAIIKLESAVK